MAFGDRMDCNQALGKPHQQARGATFGDRRQQVGGKMSYKPRPTAVLEHGQQGRLEDWQQAFNGL